MLLAQAERAHVARVQASIASFLLNLRGLEGGDFLTFRLPRTCPCRPYVGLNYMVGVLAYMVLMRQTHSVPPFLLQTLPHREHDTSPHLTTRHDTRIGGPSDSPAPPPARKKRGLFSNPTRVLLLKVPRRGVGYKCF